MSEDTKHLERIEDLLRQGNKSASLFGGSFDTTKSALLNGLSRLAVGSTEVENSFHGLAKSGASFDNNLFGIASSVAKTRMEFRDFSDFMQEQGKNLAGLGGSVVRGTQEFTNLSDSFQQEAKNLRYLNYTTKEMNNLLALTVSSRRVIDMNDERQRASTIDSAKYLGENLDKLSKITGRQREDLLHQLEDKKRRSAFNSKLEMMRRSMSATEFAAYEKSIKARLAEAEAAGHGASFMELATKGYISSTTAALQTQLQGPGSLIAQSAMKFNQGLTDAGNALMEQGIPQALAVANSNQMQLMNIMNEDMGQMGEVVTNIEQAVDPILTGLNQIAVKHGEMYSSMTTTAQNFNTLLQQAVDAQKGVDKNGNQVNNIFKAAIDISTSIEGVKTASYDIAENIKIFNTSALDMTNKLASLVSSMTPQNAEQSTKDIINSVGKYMNDTFGATLSSENLTKSMTAMATDAGTGFKSIVIESATGFSTTMARAGTYLHELYTKSHETGQGLGITALNGLIDNLSPEPKNRWSGSLGETGSLVEDGTLIQTHGKGHEGVVTLDQMNNLASGSLKSGITQGLNNSINKFGELAKQNPIDVRPLTTEIEKHSDEFNRQIGTMVTVLSNPQNQTQLNSAINIMTSTFYDMTDSIIESNVSTTNAAESYKSAQDLLKTNLGMINGVATTTTNTLGQMHDVLQQQVNNTNATPVSTNTNAPVSPKIDLNSFNLSNIAPGLSATTPVAQKEDKKPNQPNPADNKAAALAEENNKNVTNQNAILVQVLEQLKTLNAQFSQYMHQHEQLGAKQIKTTKNIGPNLFPQ